MALDPIWKNLSAQPFGPVCAVDDLRIRRLEKRLGFRLPSQLRDAFKAFGAAIAFDADVTFVPLELSGMEDEGELSIDMFYGPCPGEHGIEEANQMYRGEQVPPGFAVLGSSAFGDQLCIEVSSGRIFFWHHEAEREDRMLFLAAQSFEELLSALRMRPEGDVDLSGVIWEKCVFNLPEPHPSLRRRGK